MVTPAGCNESAWRTRREPAFSVSNDSETDTSKLEARSGESKPGRLRRAERDRCHSWRKVVTETSLSHAALKTKASGRPSATAWT